MIVDKDVCKLGWLALVGFALLTPVESKAVDQSCLKARTCAWVDPSVCYGYHKTRWRTWEEACPTGCLTPTVSVTPVPTTNVEVMPMPMHHEPAPKPAPKPEAKSAPAKTSSTPVKAKATTEVTNIDLPILKDAP